MLSKEPEYRVGTPPKGVHIRRASWQSIWLIGISIYSTLASGVWFVTSIIEPRWGSIVSTNGPISLSSANLVTAIIAKSIEMTFATVAVAFVGQVLTRRAIATHEGMTMAEVTMRTWIMQPGTVLANPRALRHVARTLLGLICILATLVVMFYTTASDTMVRPKLQFSNWQKTTLKSTILASYANPTYVENDCATPITTAMDENAGSSCLAVQYAGDSFSDFLSFFALWHDAKNASTDMTSRPQVQSMLYDNVTMIGTWIETQYSDVEQNYATWSRVINNVSLAMPHPGVYKAATNRSMNGILQPSDLDGVGSYNISASVVSPAVNVLCVNMDTAELAPLVYTTWPNAKVNETGVGSQTSGWEGWQLEVPMWNNSDPDSSANYLNRTVVDDIFHWGPQYLRRPPVFQLYPSDFNTVLNSDSEFYANATDAVYILSKNNNTANYTLCGVQSWPAIQCSTTFNVSGTASMAMSTDCSQSKDYTPSNAAEFTSNPDAYVHTLRGAYNLSISKDWKNMVTLWGLSVNLNGGVGNDNASNARILTELALTGPQMTTRMPSLAEGFASMAANTLVTGSINTPFVHYWDYESSSDNILATPATVSFQARVRSQEYASWHSERWQGVFYPVLATALLLNLLCLAYLGRVGLVRDFLEPASLFALATARPLAAAATDGAREATSAKEPLLASRTPEMEQQAFEGSGQNEKSRMGVPYRLSYREDANHFYFEEAGQQRNGNRASGAGSGTATPLRSGTASEVELDEGLARRSFARLR
ncbi:hypothetical protein BD289DRAFT_362071 [Coniella lustricola]|uniref:Mcm2 3 5 family protein n=1 Tax=Coniella lustricola TaxID=2025994 RepID=A0A2T3AHH2_9PEZI|nr:hypothetical protein BD289DRAFT_362071 [Coniella lustricola]